MKGNCVGLIVILLTLCKHTRTQTNMFSIVPGNVVVRIGFPARLDCKVNTNGFVRWSVGATKIMLPSPGCNCIVLGNSSLYFNETTHATGGDYTCAIFGGPFGEINGSITIAVDPEITPNDFSITHNENDTFALNITVTGVPRPSVTWRKDGVNFTAELTGVTATRTGLQVTNASHRAVGRYRILAINDASSDTKFYNIFINFLPIITITRDPDISEVPVGKSIILTCSIMSYPGSSVYWEQQNDNVYTTLSAINESNDTSNMFRVITNSTIMFASEDINAASKYCCVATNIIGVAEKCLEFTEHGAPPRPSGFSVTERTSSLIAVQWDPPSLDGVAHKLSYRIDNSNNGSWDRETVESGATSCKLENLRPNTSYALKLTALRSSIQSLPTSQLIVHTRISVPRDVRSFKVDSTTSPGTFVLTWQAPLGSVVDCYNVYVRGLNDYRNTIKVDGTKLGLNISDLSENVEYMFAIQAVNDGGSGNMTSYRSGILCLTTPMITAQYRLHGTTVNISWYLSDSIYSTRNIMLVIAEQSRTTFTSELIDATNRQHCVSNLRPNTRYEITVIAILGCDNVSSELDVLTQSSDTPATRLSSQNCIVFNATTSGLVSDARSGSDGRSSNSSAIISGFVGGVILLLLLITVVLCIVLLHKRRSYRKAILSLNFNVEKDSVNDVMPDLCNTIEPGDSDVPITTNPSYATVTKASEDKCKYVQTNDFDEYLDLEDTVTKMNTNPSYGVKTGNVHSASNAQSSNETDYGVVNQPKSDLEDTVTKMNANPSYGVNTGNVHSASNAQSSNETDYGVINQPKSDGPDYLIT